MMRPLKIEPMTPADVDWAGGLFIQKLARQKEIVPALPPAMADALITGGKIRKLASTGQAVVAREGGVPVGYLGWTLISGFRGTAHRAAYVAEWAHGAAGANQPAVYQHLCAVAAERWQAEGCQTHAITIMATDSALRDWLFWNGFGMAVVDAMRFLDEQTPAIDGVICRRATADDAAAIVGLSERLCAHLHAPTVCMPLFAPSDEDKQRAFLERRGNSIWLAEEQGQVVAMLRLEAPCFGASEVVRSPDTVGISGAYVLSEYRGRGVGTRLLAEASAWYRERGFVRCSVDWESFNPPATAFWLKHFVPVCYSLIRHPERGLK